MSLLEASIAALTEGQRAQLCTTCVEQTRTTRYCARFACVCGHETCHAFLSYVPRKAPDVLPDNVISFPTPPTTKTSAWQQRDSDTWIDKL